MYMYTVTSYVYTWFVDSLVGHTSWGGCMTIIRLGRLVARGGSRGSIKPPKFGPKFNYCLRKKSWFNRTRSGVYSLLFGPLHAVILTPSKVVCYFRIVSSTADLITPQPSHARQIRPTMVMNIHIFKNRARFARIYIRTTLLKKAAYGPGCEGPTLLGRD